MSEKKVPNTGFTLIEMLMVIGIFGILLGIAVPVFKDIGQGSKLDAASRELRGVLLLARQHAITKRETVYVVFPNTDAAYSAQGVSNIAYRAYAVCTTNEYLREWAFLPQGIVFDSNYPSAASANNLFQNAAYRTAVPGRWTGNQPALIFQPNGSLRLRMNHPEIALGEGVFLGTLPTIKGFTRNKIQVYGMTGLPQSMRMDDGG